MQRILGALGVVALAVPQASLAAPPAWGGHANSAQHTAAAPAPAQAMARVRWQAPVDLLAASPGVELSAHYAPPMITRANTVIVPVRTGTSPAWRLDAYKGATGEKLWSLSTNYRPPFATWLPPFPAALSGSNRVFAAGPGGTVIARDSANRAAGATRRLVFYGTATYSAHPRALANTVRIVTPITVGPDGAIYFGFQADAGNPAGLSSGIARIDSAGNGTWRAAGALANDTRITGPALNAAPALSNDGTTLYVAVTTGFSGYLVALNSTTLAATGRAALTDPATARPAWINDLSTASPTVAPDGDVYFGVLENPFPQHNDRGWLLHFDATLATQKTPGSFGWDSTVSIVPAAAMPGTNAGAGYFLMSKYNNYLGLGSGDGRNRVAILDPARTQADPVTPTVQVLKEVITKLGPTRDPAGPATATYEWCINSAVVDAASRDVITNSEDGHVYRWNLPTNTITQSLKLNDPRPEPYTPTVVGPDGTIYAINNQTLYAIGQ